MSSIHVLSMRFTGCQLALHAELSLVSASASASASASTPCCSLQTGARVGMHPPSSGPVHVHVHVHVHMNACAGHAHAHGLAVLGRPARIVLQYRVQSIRNVYMTRGLPHTRTQATPKGREGREMFDIDMRHGAAWHPTRMHLQQAARGDACISRLSCHEPCA